MRRINYLQYSTYILSYLHPHSFSFRGTLCHNLFDSLFLVGRDESNTT
jgi:hypothetical protein